MQLEQESKKQKKRHGGKKMTKKATGNGGKTRLICLASLCSLGILCLSFYAMAGFTGWKKGTPIWGFKQMDPSNGIATRGETLTLSIENAGDCDDCYVDDVLQDWGEDGPVTYSWGGSASGTGSSVKLDTSTAVELADATCDIDDPGAKADDTVVTKTFTDLKVVELDRLESGSVSSQAGFPSGTDETRWVEADSGSVAFTAVPNPAGNFPTNKPDWSNNVSESGSNATLATDTCGVFQVSAECADTYGITVNVVDVELIDKNSTSISPDICLNAQTGYDKAKFTAKVKGAGTATISVVSGDVTLSETTVSTGETEITVTGQDVGDYEIKILHDELSTCVDTVEGTVFEFKFADLTSSSSNPKHYTGYGNDGYDPAVFRTWAGSATANKQAEARVSQNYKLKVIAEPEGAFDGNVKAAAAIVDLQAFVAASIKKANQENGSTRQLAIFFSFIDVFAGGGGSNEIGGYGGALAVIFGGDTAAAVDADWDYDSTQFDVPQHEAYCIDNSFDTVQINATDQERTYTVGTTEVSLRTQVESAGETTLPFAYVDDEYKGVRVFATETDGDAPPDVEEDDGVFEIQ